MKKIICLILALTGVFIIKFSALATEDFTKDISDEFFSSIDDDLADALEEFGITDIDSESIYNISLENIFSYFKDTFQSLFNGTLKSFVRLFSVVLLTGIISVVLEGEKFKPMLSSLSVMAITLLITDSINNCLNSAISLLRLNGNFMASFVPVYAVIISVSGKPATALAYNSLVLAFSEALSALINFGLIDILGCFFCLSIAFSVNDSINYGRLISVTNRTVTFILGLLSSVFAATLTIKSSISASSDTVVSKGVRFSISSLIPVIGSSISEAYSVLLGSINIIKGSVALIGILAVTIMNIPVIAEIMLYCLSLGTLSFISEMVDCKGLSNAFNGFYCGIKIIGLMVVFEMFILIISTAVMLIFKGV